MTQNAKKILLGFATYLVVGFLWAIFIPYNPADDSFGLNILLFVIETRFVGLIFVIPLYFLFWWVLGAIVLSAYYAITGKKPPQPVHAVRAATAVTNGAQNQATIGKYITDARAAGAMDENIEVDLVSAGWKKEDIDAAFKQCAPNL